MTDPGSDAICPLEFRYGREPVRLIFSRQSRLTNLLAVEAALASVQAKFGLIPSKDAERIAQAARSGKVTLERVDQLEAELRHDLMAVTRALAETAGDSGAWVHMGATSVDVTDTALALELRQSVKFLREDLVELGKTLLSLARKHRTTAEVGRTHGQHAVPISFGYKMAVGAAEIARHLQRLDQLSPRLLVGKMAGAVGTGAGFGPHASEIEREALLQLGLNPDEAPTQLVGRDRLAEFLQFLALVSASAERLSTEVRNLQRTEIAEVSEPFDEARQVGSSTMAQKRNPVQSENVSSLARLVRALALPSLENMIQWHERDLANSANERIIVPHAVVLADDLLNKLNGILAELHVDSARMQANLDSTQGAVMSEGLMLALTQRGVPRAEAHEMLRTLSRDATEKRSLLERAKAEPRITARIPVSELEAVLSTSRYVEAAAVKTDRLISELAAVFQP